MDRRLVFVVPVLAILTIASEVDAQGAAVYTHSTCATARAGATVADPCADGSAVFYNPAALVMHPGAISLGASRINLTARFQFDLASITGSRSLDDAAKVPHAFATYPLDERVAIGIGAWAPYGLAMKWPMSFEGRFVGYDNRLRGIYVQPTIAVHFVPDRLAVGAGIAIVHAQIDLRRRLDAADLPAPAGTFTFGRASGPSLLALPIPAGTDFADADLSASDNSATWHVGVWAALTEKLSLGARYLHSAPLDLQGSAVFRPVPTGIRLPAGNPFGVPAGTPLDAVLAPLFAPGGPLVDQRLASNISLPAQFVVGLRFRPDPRLSFLADYQWTEWSVFDRAIMRFPIAPADTLHLGWHETDSWRTAAEYLVREGVSMRVGFAYSDAATPDNGVTPLLPEATRYTYTAGTGYQLSRGLRIATAIEYATQKGRRGRVRPIESPDVPAASVNVGSYDGRAWLSSVTLSYSLGGARPPAVAVPPP